MNWLSYTNNANNTETNTHKQVDEGRNLTFGAASDAPLHALILREEVVVISFATTIRKLFAAPHGLVIEPARVAPATGAGRHLQQASICSRSRQKWDRAMKLHPK